MSGVSMRMSRQRKAMIASVIACGLIAVLVIGPSSVPAKKKIRNPGKLTLATQTHRLATLDDRTRLEVLCPGKKEPYGGGLLTTPPAANGEGVFANSYERLGQQRGFHSTAVLINLRGGAQSTTPRDVTLQVLCGKKIGKLEDPHAFADLQPGDGPRTLIAKCPGKSTLIGGGHQQANGVSNKGVVVTESHRISAKSWQVVAHNIGGFAGTAVSIGYCAPSKKPLITEVSSPVTIPTNQTGTATTPPCPAGRQMDWGGWSSPPSGEIRFMGAGFTAGGTWSATGFNSSGAPATLTAHAYCLKV
jgi:hypothetical protein